MKISANSGCISSSLGLERAVDLFSAAGFDALDFSATAEQFYTDAHKDDYYREIKKYAEEKGIFFNQAHAPHPTGFADSARCEQRFRDITIAMKNASLVGAREIIVHPMTYLDYAIDGNPEMLFEMNMDFYRRLLPYCEKYGIRIAVENMWMQHGEIIGHCTCSRPWEFVKYIDTLGSPYIVACLDVGHSVLVRETPDDMIKALGHDRLKCLHVHDVDGFHDSHTLPFYGVGVWEDVMRSLAQIDYDGDLTFELNYSYRSLPSELWGDCLKYLAAIGRFLVGRFEEYRK